MRKNATLAYLYNDRGHPYLFIMSVLVCFGLQCFGLILADFHCFTMRCSDLQQVVEICNASQRFAMRRRDLQCVAEICNELR